MPMPAADIEAMIKAALPDAEVEMALVDDGDHWRATVTVPPHLPARPRVAQHKMVYDALGGRMGGVLHALQLTTAVPN
jgi:stress-induced morphogen